MTWITSFHDAGVLWFVQSIFFHYQWLSLLIMAVFMIALPVHHREMCMVSGVATGWAVICLVLYGAFREAPLLAWGMSGLVVYQLARLSWWQLSQFMTGGGPRSAHWFRPKSSWLIGLTRDYLRVDPRANVWLDLARAARGLPVTEAYHGRMNLLLPDPELPAWRLPLWRLIFWAISAKISLYRKLPRYWHQRHDDLSLDEPLLHHVLREEVERSRHRMLLAWTDRGFSEYCARDQYTQKEQQQLAAACGQRLLALRAAVRDYIVFHTDWKPDEQRLLFAARYVYESWRLRKQFDHLWANYGNENREAEIVASMDNSAGESDLSTKNLTSPQFNTEDLTSSGGNDVESLGPTGSEEEWSDYADELEPERRRPVDQQLGDEDLFSTLESEKPEDEFGDTIELEDSSDRKVPTPRDLRQLELVDASKLLEAFLNIQPQGDFRVDVGKVERRLADPRSASAAVMLLMLYCLRDDFHGGDMDRRKVDLLIQLGQRFGQSNKLSKSFQEAQLLFLTMRMDVLFERGEYTQIIDLLSFQDDADRSPYEWRLLAEAEAHMARHLSRRDELSDMRRYDAINHFFMAGFRGLWTLEYAKLLLGELSSTAELIDLLRAHSVEISHPGAAHLSEASSSNPAGGTFPGVRVIIRLRDRAAARKELIIRKNPCVIGSHSGQCQLTLAVPGLNKRHARFLMTRGQFVVEDLSKQGLQVNGGASVSRAVLQSGDRLVMGPLDITIVEFLSVAAA